MKKSYRINRFQLVTSLANALDLVSPRMANHHKRVAYIALRIAAATAHAPQAKQEVVIAASLHDIGALSTKDRVETSMAKSGHHSAGFGYELLRKFRPFRGVADLIRFHHVPWEQGQGQRFRDAEVPMGSHIIHLANRIDEAIEPEVPILVQVKAICREIERHAGSIFVPEFVDAFLQLARSESFWLDLISPGHDELLAQHAVFSDIELDLDGLLEFAGMWGQVIDFRSRYTATHSSGVAACAYAVAQRFGFPESRCKEIKVAGFLHDIGKLAIPVEVLEKPGKLDTTDRLTIRAHSYYSFRILQPITGLEEIAAWCGYHHEQLGGGGYPYRLDHTDIPLEARIVAVADVFSALTEDRPYRAGLVQTAATPLLTGMGGDGHLDPKVVACLLAHYGEINDARRQAQAEAVAGYEEFMGNLRALDLTWARESHLLWAQRFREAVRDKPPVASRMLLSPERWPLRQWYAGEGLERYGHLAQFRALAHPQRELRRSAEEIIRHLEAGDRSEALHRSSEIERLSGELVQLLDGMERATDSATVCR